MRGLAGGVLMALKVTQFTDACSVLGLDDLDELDDETRKDLAELVGLESKARRGTNKSRAWGDMVYKSESDEDSEDTSDEEFYTGPVAVSTPMINKLTRKSLNLEGAKSKDNPQVKSIKELARLSTIIINT
jgi:hypothetical protein